MKTIVNYWRGRGGMNNGAVIVVNRFSLASGMDAEKLRADLLAARDLMATKAGFVSGEVGRAIDNPTLWVLSTRWVNVGSYRRALSSYEGKLHLAPLLGSAIDEPSAFEVVDSEGDLNVFGSRGD